jgi:hypothetical protein
MSTAATVETAATSKIRARALPPATVAPSDLRPGRGVRVTYVLSGAPAEQAGFAPG